jgi:F420-0:gamma-glutamyl ligase-like protein
MLLRPGDLQRAARTLIRMRLRAARLRRQGTPIAALPKKKATYVSELERNGRKRGARALAPDVEALLAEVRAASSLEDARARVLAKYEKMLPPKALAEIVRKTNILGHLSGRFDAQDEV